MSPAARGAFGLLVGLFFCWLSFRPGTALGETAFRRPVDVGFIRTWPSHGGSLCLHGPTGAGCRFDCEPNGVEVTEDSSGVFYQCPTGTPVLAAAAGVVLNLHGDCGEGDPACQNGRGNWVLVEHPFGLRTLYTHLLETTVTVGDALACGDALGLSGATGTTAVEGLQFELQDLQYGPVDPFLGDCNPGQLTLWVEQTPVSDSTRSCAEAFVPNEGWIGAACSSDDECGYDGAVCLAIWPGGTCSAPCADTCPAHPGTGFSNPVCMLTPNGATCVAGCSSDLFPGTGCRDLYICQWLSTPTGSAAPGCLPEPGEEPDGGVPDGDTGIPDGDLPDKMDSDGDTGTDGGPDITAGGDSPACACRSPASKHTIINIPLLLLAVLLISGFRRRFFRCSAKVNVI